MIGSLFTGYGGLDLAVETVTGERTGWVSDIDPGACRILAERFPGVPNLGDITGIDWSTVRRPRIITGGFPCQDVSMAGRRAGLTAGTRSGLWSMMAGAVDALRPDLVIVENVRGLLSADGHADLEFCPGCMGDPETEPALRALGAVLGDLADIGYDAAWHGVTAAAVGAPHERFRVFVVAWPTPDADDIRRNGRPRVVRAGRRRQPTDGGPVDADPSGQRLPAGRDDPGQPEITESVDRCSSCGDIAADAVGGRCDGRACEPLGSTVGRVAPTGHRAEVTADAGGRRWGRGWSQAISAGDRQQGGSGGTQRHQATSTDWGQYAGAIHRWATVLGRPAPDPTRPGPKGGQRLSPGFVEWMMGLPDGWVTQVPDLTRNQQLKALGNGVVPQQAAAALRVLLPIAERNAS